MTNDEKEARNQKIQEVVAKLAEYFDAVQVFGSYVDDGGEHTVSFNHGSGNWHARAHQVSEWLDYHKESNREKARTDFHKGEEE